MSTAKATANQKATEKSLNTANEHLKEAFTNVKQAATSAQESAGAHLNENYAKGVKTAQDASAYAENFIKEKPLTSVAIAFGTGWLVSKLLK